MEFLKSILGDELYQQVETAVNSYNGNENNKDKQIKLINLNEGGYVSKDKYSTLETDFNGRASELEKANGLIEQLKKSAGKDSELQGRISDYESQIETLKHENEALKTENALKFALKDAGAVDVDYLIFKAKEKGEIKLDEDGKIKGIDDLIAGLKTQIPSQFESSQKTKVEPLKLPTEQSENETFTKEELLKKPYGERAKFYSEHPDTYKELMNS